MNIDRTQLQILFDVAVGSPDFGSGFLDDEEVETLRAVAVLLEVDPMRATPRNFTCKYTGRHEPYPPSPFTGNSDLCMYCRAHVSPR